jgi:hypothetical protein
MPNPFAKTRKLHEPYAIFINNQGWQWRILKTYKQPSSEAKDKFARWYVAATSPHMTERATGSMATPTLQKSRTSVSLLAPIQNGSKRS